MYVLLITRPLRLVGRWARKPVNHTSWVAVVTPTDRLKSVRNRCLIELFVALFVLSLCPFDISVGVGAFVVGLSQISSFLSLKRPENWIHYQITVHFNIFTTSHFWGFFFLCTGCTKRALEVVYPSQNLFRCAVPQMHTSMCRHIYDWNIVNCDVKQQIYLTLPYLTHLSHWATNSSG